MCKAKDDDMSENAQSKAQKSGIRFYGHRLNLFMCCYIGLNHLLAVYAICRLLAPVTLTAPLPHWKTLVTMVALWPITAMGITAGAHRLWSHRSYSAHFIVRLFLMLCSSLANQGSISHWARDHRVHHLHADTVADPHDSNRGFFYSHVGWLLVQKPEQVRAAGRKIDMSDLEKDSLVVLQRKCDPWWNFLWCFVAPALFCQCLFQNETFWNGFLYAGVVRYVFVLHCTWCVNSIVHTDFGPRTYASDKNPSESRLVAFLAVGEGWHSWHHAFPFDYATSELDSLDQYNPTKMLLDLFAALGLVWDRKRGLRMWAERKTRMAEKAATEGKLLVEKLSGPPLWRVRTIEFKAAD